MKSETVTPVIISIIIGGLIGYFGAYTIYTPQIEELGSQIQGIQSEFDSRIIQIQELQRFVPPSENKAPEFTITGIDGESFTLSDHLGEIVVIDFMATWCGICERQIPEYNVLRDNFGDQVVLISISVDPSSDSDEGLRNYIDQFDAPWTWASDTANIADQYNVQRIPTTFIIDTNGYVWAQYVGFIDSETLGVEIEQLLSYWGSYDTPAYFVTISALDAKELIDSNPDIVILDVRTPSEYGEERLEGALNLPLQELQERIGELDKNSIILAYCKTGIRSAQASQILVDNGFINIYNMDGGITEWKNEHLPIV
jgi:rhodanese-related sulfurtransferase/cytochrome oxidase Cu insertion factor (SCO1/SenC/PrrC family)